MSKALLICLFVVVMILETGGNHEDSIETGNLGPEIRKKGLCGQCRGSGKICKRTCHTSCVMNKLDTCPLYEPVVDSILDSIEGIWYILSTSVPECSYMIFKRTGSTKTTCTVIQRGKDKLEVTSQGSVHPSTPSKLVVKTLKPGSTTAYDYVTMQFRTEIHNEQCALFSLCYQGRDDLLAISRTKHLSIKDEQWINQSYAEIDASKQENRVIQNYD